MLNSGKKIRALQDKIINILPLVLSEKKIISERKKKTHSPPTPCKLNGQSLTTHKVKTRVCNFTL